jgi:hypothetical protein
MSTENNQSPIVASGFIKADGSIISNSGMESVTRDGVGEYTIILSQHTSKSFIPSFAIYDIHNFGFVSYYTPTNATLVVKIRNAAGENLDAMFCFSVIDQ